MEYHSMCITIKAAIDRVLSHGGKPKKIILGKIAAEIFASEMPKGMPNNQTILLYGLPVTTSDKCSEDMIYIQE